MTLRAPVQRIAAALTVLAVFSTGCGKVNDKKLKAPLLVYCAAGMAKPLEEMSHEFERHAGQKIELQLGGSGTLLSSMIVAQRGDIFVAADESYIDQAKQKGIIQDTVVLSVQEPVLLTAKGNPRNIHALKDLLRTDVHATLANPSAASIGKITQQMATAEGIWNELQDAVRQRGVLKPTVNDVANDVKLGVMDAGVVWDNVAAEYPELEEVPIAGGGKWLQHVIGATLGYSTQPDQAKTFLDWMAQPEKGQAILLRHKFRIPAE